MVSILVTILSNIGCSDKQRVFTLNEMLEDSKLSYFIGCIDNYLLSNNNFDKNNCTKMAENYDKHTREYLRNKHAL